MNLPTAKNILSLNIIAVHPQNCQQLRWQDVCGASRRAGSASILGWSTVLPQMERFAFHAHRSAGIGPRKASLPTPLFATGKRRARSGQVIKAPNRTRSRFFKRINFACGLSIQSKTLKLSSTDNSQQLFWVFFFLLAVHLVVGNPSANLKKIAFSRHRYTKVRFSRKNPLFTSNTF